MERSISWSLLLLGICLPFGLGQATSASSNGSVLPIWGLTTLVQGGTSPLCNKTYADANATGMTYYNPNVPQGPQTGQPDNYSGKTLAAGIGVTIDNPGFNSSDSSNTSSAYTLWYDTNGANYSDRYALGYDVCGLVGFSLNYNTQLRGQSDNGSCLSTLDQPCINAIVSTVEQYARWYTTPSTSNPSNLTADSLPNVCRLLSAALVNNFPNECSYFFDEKLSGLAYPLTSYGNQYQTGLTSNCTLNGTWQNTLSFYNNNSASIYDAWVNSVTPIIGVWMPIADAAAQTSITEVVATVICGRVTNINADSYVPPAEPAPTPVAYNATSSATNSTSSNGTAASSTNSATKQDSNESLSGGAIAGIVIGVLAGIALLVALVLLLLRRKRKSQRSATANRQHELNGEPAPAMAEVHGYDSRYEMGQDGQKVQLPTNKAEGGRDIYRGPGELEGSQGMRYEHEPVELAGS